MKIKSLTIYCSSSNNLDQEYYDISKEITEKIADNKFSIVYGGGQVGIMGVIAKNALKLGIHVTGIIPEFLNTKEIMFEKINNLKIVSDMSEMSYGAGSMGAIRPQVDMANIQSAKSPLQKLKDFDKSRTAAGKSAIFTDKGGKQFYRMKKPGTMTVMNVPERELKKYEKMGYKVVE